jgi:hypothetical protein
MTRLLGQSLTASVTGRVLLVAVGMLVMDAVFAGLGMVDPQPPGASLCGRPLAGGAVTPVRELECWPMDFRHIVWALD